MSAEANSSFRWPLVNNCGMHTNDKRIHRYFKQAQQDKGMVHLPHMAAHRWASCRLCKLLLIADKLLAKAVYSQTGNQGIGFLLAL